MKRRREPAPLDQRPEASKNAAGRDDHQADAHEEPEVSRCAGRGGALELVDETVDRDLDVDELYNALTALVVSHYRKLLGEGPTA